MRTTPEEDLTGVKNVIKARMTSAGVPISRQTEIMAEIGEVEHMMAYEGFPLTEQNVIDLADILQGKRTQEDVKRAALERYGLSQT